MPAEPNQKGGTPEPYPLPQRPTLTPDMTGIGTGAPPEDTSNNIGVREKDARTIAYRTRGTT
jgi:hypothetical protein